MLYTKKVYWVYYLLFLSIYLMLCNTPDYLLWHETRWRGTEDCSMWYDYLMNNTIKYKWLALSQVISSACWHTLRLSSRLCHCYRQLAKITITACVFNWLQFHAAPMNVFIAIETLSFCRYTNDKLQSFELRMDIVHLVLTQ